MMATGAVIFTIALLDMLGAIPRSVPFGQSWTIVAAFLFTAGHFAAIMALATHFYGVRQGYRSLRPILQRLSGMLTLEVALIIGGIMIAAAVAAFVGIALWWSTLGFAALPSTVPLLLAAVAGVVGLQTALGGVLIAVIGGHDARFVAEHQQVDS
jgi:uncharacterized membrane protein